jgi:flavocytochrome c
MNCNKNDRRTRTITFRGWQPKLSTRYHWWPGSVVVVVVVVAMVVLPIVLLVWMDVTLSGTFSSSIYNPIRERYSSDIIRKATTSKHRHHNHHFEYGDLRYSNRQPPWHPIDTYEFEIVPTMADAIVIGSGLTGLTAALTILDRGGTVILFEKEPILGGNSNKASSGINACCLQIEKEWNDTLALFRDDTLRSAGSVADFNLIDTLVNNSAGAVTWLHQRVGVDLSILAQLGGHSRKRTHRPQKGFVGAEIMSAMETAIRAYQPTGRVSIYLNTPVTQLITNQNDSILGVVTESRHGEYGKIRSDHVILATGGFASDRSVGSYLHRYRPELIHMPATAGAFSTGDGITLAERVGASTRDMEKIQLHPTGFVDPVDPSNPNKILAAEMLRGVGGILMDDKGQRFCNELGTRDYVSNMMMLNRNRLSMRGNDRAKSSRFYLLLSQAAAREANRHVSVYTKRGLLTNLQGIDEISKYLNIPRSIIHDTLYQYQEYASRGMDAFGKTVFENLPSLNFDNETFTVGEVTPVLHYCMGGLTIDTEGHVMRNDGTLIEGLYAAGEVTGGVHGNNRLGGNSLLECAVFGGIIGREVPIDKTREITHEEKDDVKAVTEPAKILSKQDVTKHNSPSDCWVSLYDTVYDLTTFVQQHPGGAKSILSLGGKDATKIFDTVHSPHMLNILQDRIVGVLKHSPELPIHDDTDVSELRDISLQELMQHSTRGDVWVVLHGTVYNLTDFCRMHPGGAFLIQKLAGKDGTDQFQVFHPKEKLDMIRQYAIGPFVQNDETTDSETIIG